MKKFRYPLDRLKQFREFELVGAADAMTQISTLVQDMRARISKKLSSIKDTQHGLISSETKTGTIQPDLRKLTSLYVHSMQEEQAQLEKILKEVEQQQEQTHEHLLEKKQSVKILENHQERLSTHYQLSLQTMQLKEDDELWLIRQKSKTDQGNNHE